MSDTKTGFLYSQFDSRNWRSAQYLAVFDWSTMSKEELVVEDKNYQNYYSNNNDYYQPKPFPTCTLFRNGSDVDNLFATLQARNQIIQVQNTAKSNPESTFTGLPYSNVDFGQLVAANNKTELLLYGGKLNEVLLDGIYRYSTVTKLWALVGRMKFPRASHVVIPVQGLSCP